VRIADAYESIRERIEAAARRAGRPERSVTLIGVSKTVPSDLIFEAVQAGLTDLGENRVQEAAAKIPVIGRRPRWHLIGHLQTNKARKAAELFDCVQSVDSAEVARLLDMHAGLGKRVLEVLVQVSLGDETTKFGVEPEGVPDLVQKIREAHHNLRCLGLMTTLPPLFDDPQRTRPFFAQLRRLRDQLNEAGAGLTHLSMGMSHDFEVAVEEGATMVRVGTALFGTRGQHRPS
jgi:pyridoxal phosphate enzyme (YggS family)